MRPQISEKQFPRCDTASCHNLLAVVKNNGALHIRFSKLSATYIDQLRRQTRERRQYVHAKSLEAQERQIWERKQQVKDALATGKSLPTELRKDAKQLGKDLAFDEAQSGVYPSQIRLALGLNHLIGRTYDSCRQ